MKCFVFNSIRLLLLLQNYIASSHVGLSSFEPKITPKLAPKLSKLCPAVSDMLSSSFSPSSMQLECYNSTHADTTNDLNYAQTANGITLPSLTASQTVGKQGPILLQDVFLLEILQSLNRERIPERVINAKGAGAFGSFTVTNDVTQYTRADVFKKVGQVTRVGVRFSTSSGDAGSADTLFDTKGFATKFYTQQGIFDLVGSNIPVFQIRDPMLFLGLLRSLKRNPQTHLHDHTAFWDMISLRPEMAMHTLYLYSDTSRPKSFTHMDGYGIHTFKMINKGKDIVYVKFHWTSNQQTKQYFTSNESVQVAGTNPDFLTQDLFDRIERNDYPSWNLSIQVMSESQASAHTQNPFDVTKFWKQEDYPLILVGTMTLDENPKDYFTQVEQIAFSPSHMVPGIEPSLADRVLQARMFAYPDAQMYRLGVNNPQIPVNRCPFHVNTYLRDGRMNVGTNGAGAPNYYPNSFNGLPIQTYYSQSPFFVEGTANRYDTRDDDNFSLPYDYIKEMITDNERNSIIRNIADDLGKADKDVQARFVSLAAKIDEEFGRSLQKALNRKKPQEL